VLELSVALPGATAFYFCDHRTARSSNRSFFYAQALPAETNGRVRIHFVSAHFSPSTTGQRSP